MDRALVARDAPGNERDTGRKAAWQRLGQAAEEWARTLLMPIGLAALFWVIDSVIHAFVFHEGSLAKGILPPTSHGILERGLIVPLLFALVYLQQTLHKRKRMEQALRESERRYRLLAENVADVIWTVDMGLRFTFVTPSVTPLLGYAVEELLGKRMEEIMPPASFKLTMEALAEELAPEDGEPKSFGRARILEAELKRKDGSSVWVERKVTVLRNQEGKPVGILGVSRDITERKRAEEELRESERKYRHLFDNLNDAAFLADCETGLILETNQQATAMLGRSREEIVGMYQSALHPPGQADKYRQKFAAHIQQGQTTDFDAEVIRKDGTVVPVSISASTLSMRGRHLILGLFRDISELKKAEAEKKLLEEKAKLASHLASIGGMAAGIAHEVNNPLTGVLGFSEILMRKDLPEAIRKDVEIIHRGAQRAASILNRMLTFARQRKAERTFTSINEIIETTLELRAYEMETNNIRATRQLDPELPGTMADATQLQQAFLNMIMNAETAIRDAHRRGNIVVRTETVHGAIRITFQDDGVGIQPENMGKIFDPFFTTREVGKGTGLGLSVCHGIIAEHGGRIYAESEPGRGTSFNVELPIVAGEKPIDLPWPADQPPKVPGARVLVVDDEPLVRELLGQELAGEGYRVETVDGAAAALDRLRGDDYHLLLLDIKMPGMSGIELYQQTCKLKPSLASRVIFITGDTMSPDTREFLSQAKVPYIAKPFSLEKLKWEIRAVLRHATIAHEYVR
ncbi:MAG: PAS domain S-box protein [Chloroflexi bacterium]|nr:PAS domain S-box protein [Chloroflexota bacterium]